MSEGKGGRHYTQSKCLECGNIILDYYPRKFCSFNCKYKNKNYKNLQSKIKKENPINYWLGKKRPEMKLVNGWNRTGILSPRKGKKYPQYSGPNHPRWKGGLIPNICEFCKKEYKPNRRCKTQRFCSSECRIEWIKREGILKGPNNWMYVDGKRSIYNYSFKKISNKLRNTFKCFVCGTDKNLLVHHVNLNKFDDSKTNLTVMCRPHHSEIHVIINRLSK